MSEPTALDDDLDLAVLVGTLSSDPVEQVLPSGSRLLRYEVTVRDRTPADTIPVCLVDARRPPALTAGDRVLVVGRVRRRFFRAGGATRSATEVLAASVSRPGRTAKVNGPTAIGQDGSRSGTRASSPPDHPAHRPHRESNG